MNTMELEYLPGAKSLGFDMGGAEGYRGVRASKAGAASKLLECAARGLHAPTELTEAFGIRGDYRDLLVEAFSTSDFSPAAFSGVATQMLSTLPTLASEWRKYTTVVTVNDFRPTRLLDHWWKAQFLQPVPELTEYPEAAQDSFKAYFISVLKMGLRFSISWEAVKNGEALGMLENMGKGLAFAADRTLSLNAVANLLKMDATGTKGTDINTDFFTAANGNAPSTLPFTWDNVRTQLAALAAKKDPNGDVVAAPRLKVVTTKYNEQAAMDMQNLRRVETTDAKGNKLTYENVAINADIVIDPTLDEVNTHAKASTFWYILPDPQSARPACFAALLRGHENPDLRIKNDQGVSLNGGGQIPYGEGSFDRDDIQGRVRYPMGHQTGDPTFTFASYGQ